MPQAQCVAFAYKASPSAGGVGAAVDLAPTLLGERNDAAICLNYNAGNTLAVDIEKTGTLTAKQNWNLPLVLQGSMIGRADENGPNGAGLAEDACFTLTATDRHAIIVENHPQDGRVKINPDGVVQTLPGQMGTGGDNS